MKSSENECTKPSDALFFSCRTIMPAGDRLSVPVGSKSSSRPSNWEYPGFRILIQVLLSRSETQGARLELRDDAFQVHLTHAQIERSPGAVNMVCVLQG